MWVNIYNTNGRGLQTVYHCYEVKKKTKVYCLRRKIYDSRRMINAKVQADIDFWGEAGGWLREARTGRWCLLVAGAGLLLLSYS